MPTINLRVTDNDKRIIEQFARFDGKSVSEYIRELIYEKIEDYEDINSIVKYEQELENGNAEIYTHDEIWRGLNIDKKI